MYKKISGLSFPTQIILVTVLLLLLTGGGMVVFADTTGPNVTQLNPATGSSVESLAPAFSLRFDDIDRLDSGAIVLQVDSQNVAPVTVAWDGIYQTYYDSCSGSSYSVRVGDDYTKGVISAKLPTLTLGQHIIYYKLKDLAGNYTENSYTFTIADSSGPQVSEFTPANSSTIAAGYPVIKAKITDPNGVDPSSISLAINNGTPVNPVFDNLTGTLTYKPEQVLRNGSYQIRINAKDTVGNPTSTSWSFTVNDTNGPVITEFVPANNGIVGTTTPVIEAKINDLSGVVNPVNIRLDTNNYTANFNAGTGKVSLPVTTPLIPGNHSVAMTVYDGQGNVGTASWGFTVDMTGPVVQVNSPPAGQIETLRPLISIGFNDFAQLDPNVLLQVDGTTVTPQIAWDGIYQTYYDSCSGSEYQVRVGDDYTKGMVKGQCPRLTQGAHTITYKLTDKVGNITQGTININISDTAGPTLTSTTPGNGAVIASGLPTITANLSDSNFIVAGSVYMYLNDTLVNASFDTAARKVSYTVPQTLLNGEYTVIIGAKDELDNPSTNSWSFTVSDVSPPSITAQTPAPGSIILDPKPVIGAAISDPSGIANPVYVELDGALYQTSYDATTGRASYVPTQSLGSGSHTVTMVAYDIQGQRGVSTWSFYLDQVGPEVAVVSPAAGSTISTVSPKISARFWDPSGVDNLKFRMLLDGTLVPASLEYDGLYQTYYDSCTGGDYTVRIGDDYTRGAINFQTSKLTNQQEHTVELYVYDKIGNVGYGSWSFVVHDSVPPVVSSLTPVPNVNLENSSPLISAKVSDNNEINSQKVSMTLNNQQVGSFNAATSVISYTPVESLPNGTYTVRVSVYDMYENQKTESWNFSITHTGAPGVNNMLPTPGSGTRTVRPTISVKVTDDRGIDISKLNITVDGTGVSAGFTPDVSGNYTAGKVYGIPDFNLSTGMHTAAVTVLDLSGNLKQAIWQFGVNQFGDMSAGTDCTSCHNEGIAAIEQRHVAGAGNCALCHDYTLVGREPDCCYCHDGAHSTSWPPPIGAYACTSCHNSDLAWAIPTHGSANELNVHNNTQMAEECKSCHSAYLTREHNVYVEGSGVAYNCNTCHKSTNTTVQNAITSKNRTCAACHGTQVDHEALHINSLDNNCLTCHKSSLTSDHFITANLTCEACHSSSKPSVIKAIAENKKQCVACHTTGHNLPLTDPVSSDIPLFSGLAWSQQLDARIFSGESWMSSEFLDGGKVIISNRADISCPTVWAFYQQEMAARGWVLANVEPFVPVDSFTATFTKGTGKAIIWFYAGENRATTPPLLKGSRLEILYKLN